MSPSLFMYDTTVVLSVATSTILLARRSWNFSKLERLLLVPDSLYAACFLGVTKTLLQCVHLSEHPTVLLMRLYISAEH